MSFVVLARRLLQTRDSVTMRKSARTLFNYSLSYLFIVFFAFMTEQPPGAFRGDRRMSAPAEIRSVEVESPEVAAARAAFGGAGP